MKQPKKLKREYKELVSKRNLNPADWRLLQEEPGRILIFNKQTGKVRIIEK